MLTRADLIGLMFMGSISGLPMLLEIWAWIDLFRFRDEAFRTTNGILPPTTLIALLVYPASFIMTLMWMSLLFESLTDPRVLMINNSHTFAAMIGGPAAGLAGVVLSIIFYDGPDV